MIKMLVTAAIGVAAIGMSHSAMAAEVLQNGNFSARLTGWTSYLTPNGTISPSNPNQGGVTPSNSPAEIATFDVKGNGATPALWLNAGQYLGPYGTSNPAGGGVYQVFSSVAGSAAFAADIAATTRFAGDAGGLFSVILDGATLGSYDFGAIGGTSRSTLSFTTNLTAGAHTLALQVVRPFAPAVGLRSQYFDNVSLNVTAVPEPAAWAMMMLGLGGIAHVMRRRPKVGSRIRLA